MSNLRDLCWRRLYAGLWQRRVRAGSAVFRRLQHLRRGLRLPGVLQLRGRHVHFGLRQRGLRSGLRELQHLPV